MNLWVWVVIVAGVVIAVALLFLVVGTPARRRAAKRDEAEQLRREAEEKLRSAAGREAAAQQEQAVAERERIAAERQLEEADVVDPDIPAGTDASDHVRRQSTETT
jgi:type VI protein secretion system component VasK